MLGGPGSLEGGFTWGKQRDYGAFWRGCRGARTPQQGPDAGCVGAGVGNEGGGDGDDFTGKGAGRK